MSATETVGDIEIQSLEETFNLDREPCSLNVHLPVQLGGGTVQCDKPAAWFLLCPRDRSAETVCDFHKGVIQSWPENQKIVFSETCGHDLPASECLWEPYS